MFHDIKGVNISTDRKKVTASWNPKKSWGVLFVEKQIIEQQPIILQIQGSGALELGITTTNPTSLRNCVPTSLGDLEVYYCLNDVKLHRRSCNMKLEIDLRKQEVISSFGGGEYRQKIARDQCYWITADMKYGDMELQLKNQDDDNMAYTFSDVCGTNIKRLNDPTIVTSLRKSPAAYCFLSQPLEPNMQLSLKCLPKSYQGIIPGRYYVKLFYTHKSPNEIISQMPNMYSLQDSPNNIVQCFTILEKEECIGPPIKVSLTEYMLTYVTSSGTERSQMLEYAEDVWLAFELFGVSLALEVHGKFDRCAIESHSVECDFQPIVHSDNTLTAQMDDPVNLETAIQKNFVKLKKDLMAKEFIDYMFESKLITGQELTRLTTLSEQDPALANKDVLMKLSKGNISKKFLFKALEETSQLHLLKYFLPEGTKE